MAPSSQPRYEFDRNMAAVKQSSSWLLKTFSESHLRWANFCIPQPLRQNQVIHCQLSQTKNNLKACMVISSPKLTGALTGAGNDEGPTVNSKLLPLFAEAEPLIRGGCNLEWSGECSLKAQTKHLPCTSHTEKAPKTCAGSAWPQNILGSN